MRIYVHIRIDMQWYAPLCTLPFKIFLLKPITVGGLSSLEQRSKHAQTQAGANKAVRNGFGRTLSELSWRGERRLNSALAKWIIVPYQSPALTVIFKRTKFGRHLQALLLHTPAMNQLFKTQFQHLICVGWVGWLDSPIDFVASSSLSKEAVWTGLSRNGFSFLMQKKTSKAAKWTQEIKG